ncbi:elongation factor P hydroxylase [Moraxella sp. FZFQ2102]|uniref:elongation factor P hydroxylase n=1 Tax=Moraxella sp. FZFQ2102 TaxID=2953752 RepID=UPI00209C1610|nr:elongation factor P hydroxylase [Moraxella sp. FZFQ2102]USZ14168.1 elongation factor P hydroxylase [Moraxella sp. FZFQ2102]
MIDFNQLSPDLSQCTQANDEKTAARIHTLWQNFHCEKQLIKDYEQLFAQIDTAKWQKLYQHWQAIKGNADDERALTEWLIELFNALFNNPKLAQMPTVLVRGNGEPEYFPASEHAPARIEFAHGFFQSALHEISHWCVAGHERRTQNDFGYWYESDGRNEQTQVIFEQVEVIPQAIECLLSLALGRYFYISQDNLNADFDTSKSTFAADVYAKASDYLNHPTSLPRDARRLLWVFLSLSQPTFHQDI